MRKAVVIGDMVKFVGLDGKAAYCKVTGFELDERSRIMAETVAADRGHL